MNSTPAKPSLLNSVRLLMAFFLAAGLCLAVVTPVSGKSRPRKEIKKWTAKGQESYKKGARYDALTAFEYVLTLDSTNREALYYRGLVRWHYRDTLGALRDFAYTTRLHAGWACGYQGLGAVLAETGHYYEASLALNEALILKPHDAQSWHYLGLCAYRMRDIDSAAACYQTALRCDSSLTASVVGLGWIRLQQGRYMEATALAEKALRRDASLHAAWYLKALSVGQEDPGFGIICIDKALALSREPAYLTCKNLLQQRLRAKGPLYGKVGR